MNERKSGQILKYKTLAFQDATPEPYDPGALCETRE